MNKKFLKRKHIILLIILAVMVVYSVGYLIIKDARRNRYLSDFEPNTPEYAIAVENWDHQVAPNAEWEYLKVNNSFLLCIYSYKNTVTGSYDIAACEKDGSYTFYKTPLYQIHYVFSELFNDGVAVKNYLTEEVLVVVSPHNGHISTSNEFENKNQFEPNTDELKVADSKGNAYSKMKSEYSNLVLYYHVYEKDEKITDVYADYNGHIIEVAKSENIEKAIKGEWKYE